MLILNELFKVLSERAMFFLFPNRNILFIKDVLVKSLERLICVIPANPGSGPGQAPESS